MFELSCHRSAGKSFWQRLHAKSTSVGHNRAPNSPVAMAKALCGVTDQCKDQEAEGHKHSKGSSQEHVRTIAAVQRLQASQASFTADPAVDMLRPKLRDNRCQAQGIHLTIFLMQVHVTCTHHAQFSSILTEQSYWTMTSDLRPSHFLILDVSCLTTLLFDIEHVATTCFCSRSTMLWHAFVQQYPFKSGPTMCS